MDKLSILLDLLEERDDRIQQDFRLVMESNKSLGGRTSDYYNGFDDGLCFAIETIKKIMK